MRQLGSFASGTVMLLLSLASSSCSADRRRPTSGASSCALATIDQLWMDPGAYQRRRICLVGFLGRMVAYGEDSPKLYATRDEAENTESERFVTIGIPMSVQIQERLSRHSVQPLRAEGVFEFDARCWPQAGGSQSDYTCSPSRPMRIAHARITFPGSSDVFP